VNQKELSQEIISSSELRVRIEEREKAFKVRERQLEKTQSELAKNFELISNRIFAEQDVKQKKGLHELLSPFKEQMGEFRKRLEEVHREETKDRNKKTIFRFIQGVVVGSIVTIIVFYGLTYKEHQRMHELLEKHGIEKHEH